MTGRMRVAVACVTGLVGFAAAAAAQIPGLPLYTNPRYGTGLRVHADFGQPTASGTSFGKLTVIQAGVSFALGPIGFDVSAGMPKDQLSSAQGCIKSPTLSCSSQKYSAAVLAQLRLMGGGVNPLSLSVFGGASADITGYDAAAYSALGSGKLPKELNIPVGAAIGFHTPFGLNIWGAPRLNLRRWINCPSGTTCPTDSKFRWAVGADLPILGVLSLRAGYDSGKIKTGTTTETISYWGVGASIGLGGMR
jgi:hypothetical protein